MARFSKLRRLASDWRNHPNTRNKAGGQAHTLPPERELISMVTTNLVADRCYASADDDLAELERIVKRLADRGTLDFAAKAAIYARTEHGLRSITHALAGLVAHYASGSIWGRRFFDRIVFRVDDLCEILAFYWMRFGADAPVPNAMKRGFATALQRFDAYQLAKYKGGQRAVSLVDVVNLCHPKSNAALDALMKGTLAPADTWEHALSNAGKQDGNTSEAKAEVWARLLAERKLGYFAALRNARNIAEQPPDSVAPLCALLTDRRMVRNSLVLPFQIAKGIDAIGKTQQPGLRRLVEALHTALDISLGNVPHLPGRTLIALDTSGSMMGQPIDIASLFAAVLLKSQDEADLLTFSTEAEYQHLSTRGSAYDIAERIKQRIRYAGTNFHSIFQTARGAYERIVILSDMQAWIGHHTPAESFRKYCHRTHCDPMVYTWDLAHYGTAQFPADKVCALAGWTDKVFGIMETVERDPDAMVTAVKAIEL